MEPDQKEQIESINLEEKPNDQTTEPTKQPEATPNKDIAEVKEAITNLTDLIKSKETTPQIKQELQEKKDELDKLLEENVSYLKENRNPKDWKEASKELLRVARESALEAMENRQKEAAEKEAKQEEAMEKVNIEQQKQLTTYWESEFDDLEKKGKIPELSKEVKEKMAKGEELSKEDKATPGVRARNDLYQYAFDNKIDDIKIAFYEYMDSVKDSDDGRKAPVAGSRRSGAANQETIPYEQLHNSSIRQFVK